MIRITEELFIEIFKLSECKDISIFDYFKSKKGVVNKDILIKDFYRFYCKSNPTFETSKCTDITYITFINNLIDLTRKSNDDFSLDDLRRCLYYFFLALFINNDSRKIDLSCVKFGTENRNYKKNYGPYYKGLDFYLKEYIEYKTRIPDLRLEALSEEEFTHIKSVFENESMKLNGV